MSDRADTLRLEVRNVALSRLTGIYSEETHLPQPLSVDVAAELAPPARFTPDDPLARSKSYLDLRDAVDRVPEDRHFNLIEAIADHIADAVFVDPRVLVVEVAITKLAIAREDETIGIRLRRVRA